MLFFSCFIVLSWLYLRESSFIQYLYPLPLPANEAELCEGIKGPVQGGPPHAQPLGQSGGGALRPALPGVGEQVLGQLAFYMSGGQRLDFPGEEANPPGEVGHVIASHLGKARHQVLYQSLREQQQGAAALGGERDGVGFLVKKRGRAKKVPRLQHAHNEGPLGHQDTPRQDYPQAPLKLAGGVDFGALRGGFPPAPGV